MLQPFTPHLAEEIWERMGKEGYVSTTPWPDIMEESVDPVALKTEEYVIKLLDDLRNIQKIANIDRPKKIILYTSSDWKWGVLQTMFDLVDEGDGRLNPGDAIKKLVTDPELSDHKKTIPKMVGRMSKGVVKMGVDERERYKVLRDESSILKGVASFFSDEIGCEVKVFSEDEEFIEDPIGKAKAASPLKPAIFME